MKKSEQKPNLNSKVGKYYVARKKQGKSRNEALAEAGYRPTGKNIEKTDGFQAIEKYFKDEVVVKMSVAQVADELVKNIKQDKDKGAKNTAIRTYLDKVEPDVIQSDGEKDVVFIVRQAKVIEGEITKE